MINLFVSSADQLYGPITTLRHDRCIIKKVPWTAFALSDSDWARVLDAKMILAVRFCSSHCHKLLTYISIRILTVFFINFQLTSIQACPALEDLQTAWEAKLKDPRLEIYHDAIKDGLAKLMKYYCRFNEKPAYIFALGKFCIVCLIHY